MIRNINIFFMLFFTIVLIINLTTCRDKEDNVPVKAIIEDGFNEEVQDTIKEDWDTFISALIWVESEGDKNAVGSKNDVGVIQITPIYLRDVNRIIGYNKYKLSDRKDSLKSIEMFNVMQEHYNPSKDKHLALKIHNSKAPLSYHTKVMTKYFELKGGN